MPPFCRCQQKSAGAKGAKNSLIAKLTGKPPNVKAFVHEVKAQSGKKIPADKAALLVTFAQAAGAP